jgi:large repetitive protein
MTTMKLPPLFRSVTASAGSAGLVRLDLNFSLQMAAGSGSIIVTDGSVQSVIDRVTGQPAMRIVGATDTQTVAVSSALFDGSHVYLDNLTLKPGHSYSVFMAPGVLASGDHLIFGGLTNAAAAFVAPAAVPAVDTVLPHVLGASVTNLPGAYGAGAVIDIEVVFSEAMKLADGAAPTLSLSNGKSATFQGLIDGGRSAMFSYQIGAGDTNGALALSGTANLAAGFSDLAGNALTADHIDFTQLNNTHAEATGSSIVIDTVAPTAPGVPELAAASDSGVAGDLVTASQALTFNGAGAEANNQIRLLDGGVVVATAEADAGGNWSNVTGTLAEGTHTLTAVQVDAAGNASAASASVQVTVDLSAAKPSAPVLVGASDTGIKYDNITSLTKPTIGGYGVEPGAKVELFEGDKLLASASADADGNYTITLPTQAEGVHHLAVRQTDVAGNQSAVSASLDLTIDTKVSALANPHLAAVSDTGVSSTDGITNYKRPILEGSGAEPDAAIKLYDGATLVSTGYGHADGTWSLQPTMDLAEGVHAFTVQTVDVAGNTSASSAAVQVTIDLSAAKPSTPLLDAASDTGTKNDNITTLATPAMVGSGVEPGASVQVFDGEKLLNSATADATGKYTISLPTLAAGMHHLGVRQTDVAGNQSELSASLDLTIDKVITLAAPVLSAASDTGASNTDRITNAKQPVLVGTGADPGAAINLYDGDTLVASGTASSDGTWSLQPKTDLGDGAHALSVQLVNAAGNAGARSAPLAVTIDLSAAAPSAPVLDGDSDTGVQNDNLTNLPIPTITGSGVEAGAKVDLFDGETLLTSVTADATGNYKVTAPTLGDGLHHLAVRQTDVAGNVSALSSTLDLTVDTVAPTISWTKTVGSGAYFELWFSERVLYDSVTSGALFDQTTNSSTKLSLGANWVDNVMHEGVLTTMLRLVPGHSGNLTLDLSNVQDRAGNHVVVDTSQFDFTILIAAPVTSYFVPHPLY